MFSRICFHNAGVGTERIYVDMNLDTEFRIVPGIPYFGLYESKADTEVGGGIVLTPAGEFDLGWGFESSGRFHRTNLRLKKIELGGYMTVWWKWDAEPEEQTYVIASVTKLSETATKTDIPKATKFHIQTLEGLPKFRARVKRSFDIKGYDNTIYRPPVGVEGDVTRFQEYCVFCPDGATSKTGQLIVTDVDPDDIELMHS